ncbi:MAG: hypothetical protein KDA20_10680 [Phycisphaerales bacterium]|nr:hypothetical protein [Phycisphaerales bacterium]
MFTLPASGQGLYTLGELNGSTAHEAFARGMSRDGKVVAGQGDSANGTEDAFRWTPTGGISSIGDLPGGDYYSSAFGISPEGTIIVGESVSTGSGLFAERVAFLYSTAGMITFMYEIGDLPGGINESFAVAASINGEVVVGQGNSANGPEAFRWSNIGGLTPMGDLPGGVFQSVAVDVSDNGTVIIGRGSTDAGTELWRWTQATGMVGYGDLAGGDTFCNAFALSGDGSTAVGLGSTATGHQAFRWTVTSGFEALGDLPGGSELSAAFDVTSDGSIIVGRATDAVGARAFIWDEVNGMRMIEDLLIAKGVDIGGWLLESATGISQNGRYVIGQGMLDGNFMSWYADLGAPAKGPACPGDLNGDNIANLEDLQLLLFNFGASCP